MSRRPHYLSPDSERVTEFRVSEEICQLATQIFEFAVLGRADVVPDAPKLIRELAYTIRDRTLVLAHLAQEPSER